MRLAKATINRRFISGSGPSMLWDPTRPVANPFKWVLSAPNGRWRAQRSQVLVRARCWMKMARTAPRYQFMYHLLTWVRYFLVFRCYVLTVCIFVYRTYNA